MHHTVSANDYAPEESAGIVLGIARYHRDSNGWNDIGYNFLVDQYGQVFEGRAGGVDQPVIGAQAQGYNSVSTGIACIGTFTSVPQSEAGLEALAHLIGWKLSLHGVPTEGTVVVTSRGGASNRYPSGTPVTLERIPGHRDGDSTSCPGEALYGQLPDLRARATRYAGPAGRADRARVEHPHPHAPVQLSGRLAFPDGSSPAGAPLDIEFAVPGAAFSRVAGTVCAVDGTWTASVPLTVSGLIRAAFRGDGVRQPLASSPVAIRVLPTLRLGLSSRRVRHGRAIAISGTISPKPASGRVEIRLERLVGRRWVRVQRKRIAVRQGRYLTRAKLRRRGLYRVSVIVPGASKHLRVRARCESGRLSDPETDHEPQPAPGLVDRADLVVDERLASASSRTTSSVRSVSTFDARFGQAIHSPAAGCMRSRSTGIRLASSARRRWKARITSATPVARVATCTPSGRSSAKPSGAPSSSRRWPGLIPSLRGNGVAE